ncbi:MAG TPA: Rieske 2Fe-2S domain-containing protein [Acidimicrobiia bacterium]|nr:Rieske 2Fe-2S domain-containing protein [Acidimicrobiia bacterium]
MSLHDVVARIGESEGLDRLTRPVSDAAKRLIPAGRMKDALSGTRLGHPAHPMLTDMPIGAFTAATVLDVTIGTRAGPAVERLVAVGLAAAVPTALTGLSDWSDTYGADQRTGLVHGVGNVVSLALFSASLVCRRAGTERAGRFFGLAGLAVMAGAGYLGGHLSFARGVGVNNAFFQHGPGDWTAVLDETDLVECTPTVVPAGDATVLLYRRGAEISAISNRCSHAGGPLDEGKLDGETGCVVCPWHQSVFRLDTGAVVHGPASVPQQAYETRIRSGQIEIRRAPVA